MMLLTLPCLPCAACHGTAFVSVFSGKIVSGINVVVRTDNQSVPKINLWLSVTIFGCLGQPDNHYYEPWIYRNLYENTGPAYHTERLYKQVTQRHSTTEQFQKVLFDFHIIISWHFMINLVLSVWNAKPCHFTFLIKRNALYSARHNAYHIKGDEFIANNTMANKSAELAFLSVNQ